jgi:ABC-type lipoprotein export system ATPase subunit
MLLELKNINKIYPAGSEGEAKTVLKDVSLKVETGNSLAIVGPSGSGKSTLLNIMGSLDKPTEGEVFFDDQNTSLLSDEELTLLRNRKIGFIFQQHHLLPQCTVMENVLLPTIAGKKGTEKNAALDRGRDLLDRVGLSAYINERPAHLSGGEQQRVAVVRALINQPQLLLADEPTGSLDQETSDKLGKLLGDLNKERNVALIVVTHSLKLAANMQVVCELNNGKLERRKK